jgi:hypothetical protein
MFIKEKVERLEGGGRSGCVQWNHFAQNNVQQRVHVNTIKGEKFFNQLID